MSDVCDGPLIWFAVGDPDDATVPEVAAILECAASGCDYIVITGSWNDARHNTTPILREGIAS